MRGHIVTLNNRIIIAGLFIAVIEIVETIN